MMFAAPALAQEKKPNVVFILVDNIGWGAFGVYGGTIPTPRIDKMASEGIRFNNYNVEAQCTPSRSAILMSATRDTRTTQLHALRAIVNQLPHRNSRTTEDSEIAFSKA
jgi:sulfatase-like protein